MVVMFLLMIALTVLQGHEDWYSSSNSPAQCLFSDLNRNISEEPAFWMRVNILLLLYGYGSNISNMFDSSFKLLHNWLSKKPITSMRNAIKSLQRRKKNHSLLLAKILTLLHLMFIGFKAICESQ